MLAVQDRLTPADTDWLALGHRIDSFGHRYAERADVQKPGTQSHPPSLG
ncbi:hypothetical protein SAMN05444161_7844 [Rhizobiales bacterium GAS191]|nr:hypothetical protein SAMN05444161_7844 [Rhizobiales bacterium GAS191]